jgi:ribonuclease HII
VKYEIGADEVGNGALAGPVVVCAVLAPEGWSLEGLKDSKRLSPNKIIKYNEYISQNLFHSIAFAESSEVDRLGLHRVLGLLFASVVDKLRTHEMAQARVIIDGLAVYKELPRDTEYIAKADDLVPVVSAASVVAKHYRDRLMDKYGQEFPPYQLERNKGYGTATHLDAIARYGLSPIHRKSFGRKDSSHGQEGNNPQRSIDHG